jgi:hypothetical protein
VSHDLLSVAQHTYIPGRLWEERAPLVQKVDTQRSRSVVWCVFVVFLKLWDLNPKKGLKLWIYVSYIHWVPRGTGTPTDRDEVNRREFWVCDGWVCDLETIGVPSIFKTIRNAVVLSRTLPTLDLTHYDRPCTGYLCLYAAKTGEAIVVYYNFDKKNKKSSFYQSFVSVIPQHFT